ncbi:MAG: hypothetical protein JWL92_442 [Candidatus Nomurabacteria bacterium]|nr:hypothetical protein [Candidatus Nomurabacteria bacterium]
MKSTFVIYSNDFLDLIRARAKDKRLIIKDPTNDDLELILKNGFLEIEGEHTEDAAQLLFQLPESFPMEQFLRELAQYCNDLAVFINNLDPVVFKKYLLAAMYQNASRYFLVEHFISRYPKLGETQKYSQLYGSTCREKISTVIKTLVVIGKELLSILREKLEEPQTDLIGIKGFKKDTIISDFQLLGLIPSTNIRRIDRYDLPQTPFILRDFLSDEHFFSVTPPLIKRAVPDFIKLYKMQ